MASPTQRDVTFAELSAYARRAFGHTAAITAAEPLSGGGFAAVWRVDLADGRRTVAKIGPPADAKLLRYERDLIPAEAAYLAMAADAGLDLPLPRLLRNGEDWLFSTFLPGTPLSTADSAPAREELGAAVARLHTVEGTSFGYAGDRPHGSTWPQAYEAMIEALLADAQDWSVEVPVEAIRAAVAGHRKTLDTVDRPVLLHFDLWDGNVLAEDGRLTGLVDGERWLYGDPLVDFVSPALYRRIEDLDHPFTTGYFGGPHTFDESERTRLSLYRLHLYLLMTVEMPSRAMADPARGARLARLLADELAALRSAPE
jgi:aminoglycoside phosphotransferase (APT) family kinase protein